MYADVDEYVDGRRRRHRENNVKELVAKKRKPTVVSLFADVKSDLQTVTAEQWMSIPDVKPHAKKKVKQARKLPITDKVLYQAATEAQVMPFEQTSNSDARGSVIAAKLDRVGGISTAAPSVDPIGYITEINSMKISSQEEISDLKKLRTLIRSLIDTNPTHVEGWITAARVEEKDGKLAEARTLLGEGLKFCPESEDIWMETARLAPVSQSKEMLLSATAALPHSIKLWIALASKSTSDRDKLQTLRQGLEINPESVRLWKEVIQLAPPEDARMYLRKAVTCVPQSLELWLALARLENYENAKAVLSKARKLLPLEFVIWVYAAKLEETNGNLGDVERLIQRGLKTLTKMGVVINRQEWLKEALIAEQAGSVNTARSIVKATIETGVTQEEKAAKWQEDAQTALTAGCLETARALLEAGLETLPRNIQLWRCRLNIEKHVENFVKIKEIYAKAVEKCPQEVDFWLEYSELVSKEDASEAVKILESGLIHHSADLKLFLRLSRLYIAIGDFEKAKSPLLKCDCGKAWKEAAKLALSQGDFASCRSTLISGISKHPKYPRLYLLLCQLEPDISSKRSALDLGMKQCPESSSIWIQAASLEESQNNAIRARFILEKARRHCQSEEVWAASVGLEVRSGLRKAAEMLIIEGLRKYPQSGRLWTAAIQLEPRATRKAKIVDALDKCADSPEVMLEAAKLFWEERKMEKARLWFRKCVDFAGKWGDAGIYWYLFETQQEDCRAEEVMNLVKDRQFKYGDVWELTDKLKSTRQRVEEGAEIAAARELIGIARQ